MKGVSLSINTVIIIVLAIIVLIFVVWFFASQTTPTSNFLEVQAAWQNGCYIYLQTGERNPVMDADIDNDGLEDSFFKVCKAYFNRVDITLEECLRQCEKEFGTKK